MSTNNQSSSLAPLISGTIAGAASTILLYPLDLVKVRLQVNESTNRSSSSSSLVKINNEQQQQLNQHQHQHKQASKGKGGGPVVRMIRGIIRHEGLIGLYSGITPAVVGSSISWGGYFFLYEGVKRALLEQKRNAYTDADVYGSPPHNNNIIDQKQINIQLGPMENFSAACISGAIMVGFTNPIWLIKTRMQLQIKLSEGHKRVPVSTSTIMHTSKNTQRAVHLTEDKIKPPYKNMVHAARTIANEEGLAGLYKGSVPALMLVSHGGVQFVCYEFLKGHFGVYQKAASRSENVFTRLEDSIGYLTIGAISKIVATTATYPLQVIKSRLQQRSQTTELTASGEIQIVKRQYTGFIDCMTKIWMREGVYGFFKGCLPNGIRVAPSAAITFVVYESMIDFLST